MLLSGGWVGERQGETGSIAKRKGSRSRVNQAAGDSRRSARCLLAWGGWVVTRVSGGAARPTARALQGRAEGGGGFGMRSARAWVSTQWMAGAGRFLSGAEMLYRPDRIHKSTSVPSGLDDRHAADRMPKPPPPGATSNARAVGRAAPERTGKQRADRRESPAAVPVLWRVEAEGVACDRRLSRGRAGHSQSTRGSAGGRTDVGRGAAAAGRPHGGGRRRGVATAGGESEDAEDVDEEPAAELEEKHNAGVDEECRPDPNVAADKVVFVHGD